jgi:hypothetical protein
MSSKLLLNYEFGSCGKEQTFYNLKILKPSNKKNYMRYMREPISGPSFRPGIFLVTATI